MYAFTTVSLASGDSADYEQFSQSITLDLATSSPYCVDLNLIGDEVVEGQEYFVLSVSAMSGPVEISNQNTTVQLRDNDCEW